jgi:hypothetical protein
VAPASSECLVPRIGYYRRKPDNAAHDKADKKLGGSGIMRIRLKIVGNSPFRFQIGDIIPSKDSKRTGIIRTANYMSESEIGLRRVVYEIIDANGKNRTEYQRDIGLL